MKNFFTSGAIPDRGREVFDTLFSRRGVTIERIRSNSVSEGEWYDQEHDEWVILVSGEAVLEFEGSENEHLQKGDHLFIPARRRHRVLRTSGDALWLAVHMGIGG